MSSMSLLRRLISAAFLYACLEGQRTFGNKKARHRNVCINCTCYDQHKDVYNLWPLQNLEHPEDPSFIQKHGDYTFSYSPCLPFKLGQSDRGDCRDNVAICRSVTDQDVHYEKIAEEGRVKLEYDNNKNLIQLVYNKIVTWSAKVILTCDRTIEDAKFEIVDVNYEWTFNLTHKCLCPNACLTEETPPTDPADPPDTRGPTDPTDPIEGRDPTHSSQKNIKGKIAGPIGALVFVGVIVAGFLFWKRRQRQNNGNDFVNDHVDRGDDGRQDPVGDNNERRHLVDQEAEAQSSSYTFVNPLGRGEQNNDNDLVNDRAVDRGDDDRQHFVGDNNERQRLANQEPEAQSSGYDTFVNPFGGGGAEPVSIKSCDITESKKAKDNFNKSSAPV